MAPITVASVRHKTISVFVLIKPLQQKAELLSPSYRWENETAKLRDLSETSGVEQGFESGDSRERLASQLSVAA